MLLPSSANALIITVAGKRCRLLLNSGATVEAIARGRLFQTRDEQVVVGDYAVAEEHHGQWMVEKVLPRRNEFVREGLRKERQVLFANADRVLILAALAEPRTKAASVDRFLVAALNGGIPPMLILTKTDLDRDKARATELREIYTSFDLPVYPVCNITGDGVEAIAGAVGEGTTAFVGNSGVGKTSLLNRLIPGLDLRVREVSTWSGKGTHTTTAALIVPYGERAMLVDTAGMKSFIPYGIARENLADLFPDIARLAPGCRFRNCRHQSEPDCAVRAAAERGDLAALRLRSYYRILEGLEAPE